MGFYECGRQESLMQVFAGMKEMEDSLVRSLVSADDAALITYCEECQQRIVNEMGVVCWRRKLKVNVNKNKVMKVSESGEY